MTNLNRKRASKNTPNSQPVSIRQVQCDESKNPAAPQALGGIRVLEYGHFISAPFCTRLLGGFGAEVIKIEAPGCGDESRRRGPFFRDVPDPERSGLFLYVNLNKMGITLNPRTETGKKIFKQLVKQADVLVENNTPAEMKKLGLDYETLKQVNPRLIVTSITPFGQTGPYRDFKAYPLNTEHDSAIASMTGTGESYRMHSDREPIGQGGFVGEYDSGVVGAFATMVALFWREMAGLGQHVDISQQEVLASQGRYAFARINQGYVDSRASRAYPIGGMLFCKDGFVEIMPMFKKTWDGLLDLLGNPEWATKPEYEYEKLMKAFGYKERGNEKIKQEVNDYLQNWLLERTKDEIYHQGQAKGTLVAKISTAEDVVKSGQLAARKFFVDVEHPEVGKLSYPSTPGKLSETPWSIIRRAPLLGEHNKQVYCERLGYSREDVDWLKQSGII